MAKKNDTKLTATIKGLAPMLMHNGQLADPLNEFAVKLKRITAKKTKVEADYLAMRQIEIAGSLYLDDDGDVCVTSEMIEGMLTMAGAKRKLKKQFQAGLVASEPTFKLDYRGRKPGLTREQIAADPQFCDRRKAGVAGKSVQRCRPIFHDWSLTFSVDLLPGAAISIDDVKEALSVAGSQIGLSDYRPKFGRFEVVKVL